MLITIISFEDWASQCVPNQAIIASAYMQSALYLEAPFDTLTHTNTHTHAAVPIEADLKRN